MDKKKVVCPRCNAKGYVNRLLRVTCPTCGGEKWIYAVDAKDVKPAKPE